MYGQAIGGVGVGTGIGIAICMATPGCAEMLRDMMRDLVDATNGNGNGDEDDRERKCQTFYRGDVGGKKSFYAPMLMDKAAGWMPDDAYELIRTESFETLATDHAMDSEGSPYISLTTNYMTAEAYAMKTPGGRVYTITLPRGRAIFNPYNVASVYHRGNGQQYDDDEWLVPVHIPSKYVNNEDGCGCD